MRALPFRFYADAALFSQGMWFAYWAQLQHMMLEDLGLVPREEP